MMQPDSNTRYGTVSRLFHWSMALLILWQFVGVLARVLAEDSAVEKFFWSTHKPLGVVLLVLALVRLIWTLANLRRRPRELNWASALGHMGLYGLLVAIPALGLLRQYGSGRTFDVWGLPLFTGFEGRIDWMVEPGNLLHGNFGWILLAAVAGHIFMVFWHRRGDKGQNVLPRMWG
ncbi:cytochrome b [Gilvimarinus xylanilyticus]|uniref:Cytochrome b/b6 domain-containing protein n=1 Tax=Gilvimarinus xylanilyticus TaxID=2944139 RepID=A0A9X2I2E9_9GAMM|nr:cytochrome b/b6 domain-containing protein [Gilvimarinus xylanilyticus]MCP8897692.1 cytochrome b/b6 domain-containing protein [Gilvimarinus xylanilyticus]